MSTKTITIILFVCLIGLYGYYNTNTLVRSHPQQENTGEIPADVLPDVISSNITDKTTKQQASNSDVTQDIDIYSCLSALGYDSEDINALDEKINQPINASFSPEDAFNYAVFATPPNGKNRLDLLLTYQQSSPSNPIIGNGIITSCIQSSDDRCTNETIADAINTDRNNGATWLNAILFYAANEDDENVINAILALEKTSVFNERFGEFVLSYTQALEGVAGTNFSLNAMSGIGKHSFVIPPYSPITEWCKNDTDNSNKAGYCLTLGEQLETRSKTRISEVIGFALQGIAYVAQGNNEARLLLLDKKKEVDLITAEAFQNANAMFMLDEKLMRSWLKNLDVYGEVESQKLFAEEAELLYAQNDNYLCSMVYNLLDSF